MGDNTPRVWVGCLACYNHGKLVGLWVDAIDAEDLDVETVHAGNGVSYAGHEELWVMDNEGFGGLIGECAPTTATKMARLLDSVGDRDAFIAFLHHDPSRIADEDVAETFNECYAGTWDNARDYAQDVAADSGRIPRDVEWPLTCIDWDRAARELMLGGDIWAKPTDDGSVMIFRAL